MSSLVAAATQTVVVMITLTKEQVEAGLPGVHLTYPQWRAVTTDVQARLDTYVENHLLADITDDYNAGAYDQ